MADAVLTADGVWWRYRHGPWLLRGPSPAVAPGELLTEAAPVTGAQLTFRYHITTLRTGSGDGRRGSDGTGPTPTTVTPAPVLAKEQA